jgi:hypothetical protein
MEDVVGRGLSGVGERRARLVLLKALVGDLADNYLFVAVVRSGRGREMLSLSFEERVKGVSRGGRCVPYHPRWRSRECRACAWIASGRDILRSASGMMGSIRMCGRCFRGVVVHLGLCVRSVRCVVRGVMCSGWAGGWAGDACRD